MNVPVNKTLPVIPVRNTVIFPGTTLPLRIGRPGSLAAVDEANRLAGADPGQEPKASAWVLLVAQEDHEIEDPGITGLKTIGTVARIERTYGTPESGLQIVVRGMARYRVQQFYERSHWIEAHGDLLPDEIDGDEKTRAALLESVKEIAQQILNLVPGDTESIQNLLSGIDDLGYLTNLCAANLDLPVEKKQEMLETVSVKDRALTLLRLMQELKEMLEIQGEIRTKMSRKLSKTQRDTILREQLKAIREELGEGESEKASESLRDKIESAGMPEEVKKTALEELKRLETIGNSSPEAHVIRNYLDLLVALPWNKPEASGDAAFDVDLDAARATLDADHAGMEKIKRRILEHLAVMKLRKNNKGSILLFVGPPGVGKTSLGQSIAKALKRKYARVSLGGVRDDAEIRGHRRTYIGAMPGRIIQALKRAGENNPVFILDEIDKLGRGFQGDPAAALLEVLDPEQNAAFLDHYLDVPFDLSRVFFIATANSLEGIPGPLMDRMEVIELSGYTTAEKLHIAKNHLIPKQLKEHGLTAEELQISDEAILKAIHHHTREAGVRELQRLMASLCRGSSERVLRARDGGTGGVRLEIADVEEILGPDRYTHEVAERVTPPGVVTGLAWTPVGGDILFIETTRMPGKGHLTLTGQLGDVMKESAQIALSLIRARGPGLVGEGEAVPAFETSDVHLHVPSGAIPKDGPSAGVAILSSLASLFSGRRVSPKVAMTGEITLRGAVTPVGGIKEKVLAAHRAGIEKVILPKRNEKDLRDVPADVKGQLKFVFVDHVNQVLKEVLGLDVDLSPSLPPGSKPAGDDLVALG